MAATQVKLQKAELNKGVNMTAASALDGSAGALIEFGGQDTKTILIFSGSGTATIKAGTGIQGVADLEITAQENGVAVELDSGAYKITTGENKGKVKVTGATTVKVQAILLA